MRFPYGHLANIFWKCVEARNAVVSLIGLCQMELFRGEYSKHNEMSIHMGWEKIAQFLRELFISDAMTMDKITALQVSRSFSDIVTSFRIFEKCIGYTFLESPLKLNNRIFNFIVSSV